MKTLELKYAKSHFDTSEIINVEVFNQAILFLKLFH
jgi:hypothetical protein